MAINQAVCASFKQQLLQGDHDIDNDTINLALYTSSATLNGNTTAYSATNEVGNSGTYAAGGATWNWADNREIGWASWGSEIGGGGSAAVRPPVFNLVDSDFIIVEDLYIYNQSAAIDLGYYIELEKVKISEWEGALSMVRARSQG